MAAYDFIDVLVKVMLKKSLEFRQNFIEIMKINKIKP